MAISAREMRIKSDKANSYMHELLLLLGFKFSLDIYVIFLNFMGLSFESFHIELWPSTRPLPESIVGLSPSVLPEYSPAARGALSCVSPEGTSWTVRSFEQIPLPSWADP